MEAILNHTEFKIDKSDWVLKKFGDVVEEPKEICKDILAEGIEHVVGLEHIESGNIHLRKSATIEESTTFSKKFKKGDVLFGRRRAYLKKAAQAEFEGICSGDITVFRAKAELSPLLLPFIVYNDKFFDYAVKHSAGGLSPRVKFKDLANYEFLFPPKDEQARLAELLWAIDDVIESRKGLIRKTQTLLSSILLDLIKSENRSALKPKSYKYLRLEELVNDKKGSIRRGPFGSALRKEYFVNKGVKVYEQSNVIYNDFKKGNYFISNEKFKELKNFEIQPNDILISCSGTIGKVAIVPRNAETGIMNQALLKLTLNEKIINSLYFKNLFESEFMQLKLLQKVQGSAMKNLVALSELKNIQFPVVDIECQNKINNIIELFQKLTCEPLSSSQSLQKSLINQIF